MYVHCSLKYGQSFGGGDGASDANDCVLLNGRVMQMIVLLCSTVNGPADQTLVFFTLIEE